MSMTMDDFTEKYGEVFNNAFDKGELDKGIKLAENLFLVEDMTPEVRVAVASMALIFIGMQLRENLLRSQALQAVMKLSDEESEAVKLTMAEIVKSKQVESENAQAS